MTDWHPDLFAEPESYECVDDRYGKGETYTVEEFLQMCHACFGEEPDLVQHADGSWYHRAGSIVPDTCNPVLVLDE